MFTRKSFVINMHKRVMFFFILCFRSKWPQAENEGERH